MIQCLGTNVFHAHMHFILTLGSIADTEILWMISCFCKEEETTLTGGEEVEADGGC